MVSDLRLERVFRLIVQAAPHHSPEALRLITEMLDKGDEGGPVIAQTCTEAASDGALWRVRKLLSGLARRVVFGRPVHPPGETCELCGGDDDA